MTILLLTNFQSPTRAGQESIFLKMCPGGAYQHHGYLDFSHSGIHRKDKKRSI